MCICQWGGASVPPPSVKLSLQDILQILFSNNVPVLKAFAGFALRYPLARPFRRDFIRVACKLILTRTNDMFVAGASDFI